MRSFIRILVTSLLGLIPVASAQAQGTVTQGDWSIVYPDFSKLASDKEWVFEIKANGTNVIEPSDLLWLEIFNSANQSIGSGTYLHKGASVKSVKEEVTIIYHNRIANSDLTKGLNLKLRVDRFSLNQLKGGNFTFNIPASTFPKRPTLLNDYIKLNSDFSKSIEFPKECSDVLFSYTMNDPYRDIDQVNFDIVDANGKSLAGAYSYGYRSETIQGDMTLCPYSLEAATGPFAFQIELQFESTLNKAPLVSKYPYNVGSKFAAVDNLVSQMPVMCQKGSTYKTSKGGCSSGYKSVSFSTPTTIQWNSLTRSANSMKGKKFLVYGCVAQFDTNTGGSKFRAYSLPAPADRYYSGANSLYTGSTKSLLKLSKDDSFAAKVVVSGATTYTTLGGKTSVPTFSIKDFVKIGKC
jgi:hypothetical protein